MRLSAKIRPENSIVFIHGEPENSWPFPIWGAQILATNSAVSVTCMPEVDGPTTLIFGDVRDVGLDRLPDYEGILRASGNQIFISTSAGHDVLKLPANELSLLKVWKSHPLWPEKITVGIEVVADFWEAEQKMLPTDQTRITTISLPDPVSNVFLSDGMVPRQHRDFIPWHNPNFMESGFLFEIGKPFDLTIVTDIPKNLIAPPNLDRVLQTPSREIQLFDSRREKAFLKIDVPQSRTRIRAWLDKRVARDHLTIVLTDE